jgi:N-acetylmuramoyl-L-alanine amidase
MKICIDPGHGGKDPGAVGSNGLHEADVNLTVSKHIATGLEKLGVSAALTRETDVFVELPDRCEFANDWAANYFVSVHCNSDGPSAAGIETLYASANGEALATPIQEMMIAATNDTDRGLKYRSDLYVLNGTRMPAALAEIGFISHPDTEEMLKKDSYQKLVADSITAGIAKHLNLSHPMHKEPLK